VHRKKSGEFLARDSIPRNCACSAVVMADMSLGEFQMCGVVPQRFARSLEPAESEVSYHESRVYRHVPAKVGEHAAAAAMIG
jgi:hypothetical protein